MASKMMGMSPVVLTRAAPKVSERTKRVRRDGGTYPRLLEEPVGVYVLREGHGGSWMESG